MPQTLGLLPELMIGENIGFPLRLGARVATDPSELMDQLGIGAVADRPPDETSLGEQQRAAVARALVTSPMLLVADEPTSHQDETVYGMPIGKRAQRGAEHSCQADDCHDRACCGCITGHLGDVGRDK